MSPTAGNRFDVLGGGVLYAADRVECCFVETLARFRPSPEVRNAVGSDPGYMEVGTVPRQWREDRLIFTIDCEDPLPFLDVDHPDSWEHLTRELIGIGISLDEHLDGSDIRSRDRILTRRLASLAFTARADNGQPRYSGIRCASRLATADENWKCWAIFGGTPVTVRESRVVEKNDSALVGVCRRLGLNAF